MSAPDVTEEHIAAAQLRMVLDQKLGRTTPETVRRLATRISPKPTVQARDRTQRPADQPVRSSGTTPLRVVVADDHQLFRYGLASVLATEPGIDVVGDASTAGEVVSAAARLAPDVILLDPQMQDDTGADLVKTVLDAQPDARVLILTMFEDTDMVLAAMRAGAAGYLRKSSDRDDIIAAVRAIGAGEAIFDATTVKRIADHFDTSSQQRAAPELTSREREVLRLVASGRNNSQIARDLSLSLRTVRNHISSVFAKLQITDPALVQESKRGDA